MRTCSNISELNSWREIDNAFAQFPSPAVDFDPEGEPDRTVWVFRGHNCSSYELEPSIERAAKGKGEWAALESMVLDEFQAKARMHMDLSDWRSNDRLSWLALMQHYGIPTRLLDFTYSPYVALYFAIRNRLTRHKAGSVAIWAIDAQALVTQAKKRRREGDKAERKRKSARGERTRIFKVPPYPGSNSDSLHHERVSWADLLSKALGGAGFHKNVFNREGLIALALPPVQNQRLSSQQGAFLLNGADDLTFKESLFKMMNGCQDGWYQVLAINPSILDEAERKLFQMNVHELSLFPDMEGLGGFIRQKCRLHWMPR